MLLSFGNMAGKVAGGVKVAGAVKVAGGVKVVCGRGCLHYMVRTT